MQIDSQDSIKDLKGKIEKLQIENKKQAEELTQYKECVSRLLDRIRKGIEALQSD